MDMSGRAALERWWETSSIGAMPAAARTAAADAGAPLAPAAMPASGVPPARASGVPMVRAAARTAAETSALASQRLRAIIASPQRFMACRTPVDMINEQLRFWHVATDQYNTALRNVQAAWSPVLPGLAVFASFGPHPVLPPPHTIARTGGAATPAPATWRDMITLQPSVDRDPAVPAHASERHAA